VPDEQHAQAPRQIRARTRGKQPAEIASCEEQSSATVISGFSAQTLLMPALSEKPHWVNKALNTSLSDFLKWMGRTDRLDGYGPKKKAPPRRMAGPACLGTRGTAFLIVGQGAQSNEKASAQRGGSLSPWQYGRRLDGASFLPRPQILNCGSAATFRLQIQSLRAGIVPTGAGQRVGLKRAFQSQVVLARGPSALWEAAN
jgi:hypothetical protein